MEDWEYSGVNYLEQAIYSRVISEYVYDSEEERRLDIERVKEENNYDGWRFWDREIDGRHKFFLQIIESKIIDLPKGHMLDFPWYQQCYPSLHSDDLFFGLVNDHDIDESIRDILISLNKIGFKTWSSCSGLIEDHISQFPYCVDEMSDGLHISFLNCEDCDLIRELIDGTEWMLEMVDDEFIIYSKIDGDEFVYELWDVLRERIMKINKEGLIRYVDT